MSSKRSSTRGDASGRKRSADVEPKFMRWGRVVLLSLLAAATLVPSGRAAEPRPSELGRVALGGVNFISADRSAQIQVRIRATTRVDFEFGRNRDLRVDGPGRFSGIVLTRAPRVFQEETLVGGVFRRCSEPGCSGRATRLVLPMNMRGQKVELPAGDYVLYALADGGDVDVRLLLHGLEGTKRLHATTPADVSFSALPVHAGGPAPSPHRISGATFDLSDAAMVVDALWFEGTPSGFTDIGTCLYKGRPPVEEEVGYSAACGELGARERGGTGISASHSFAELLLVFDVPLAAGLWSAGTHLSCSCVLKDSGTWRLVLQR